MYREHLLTDTFVDIAKTLTGDVDLHEFLHHITIRCVQLLRVDAAGIMLADESGQLRLMADSSEQTDVIDFLDKQRELGPAMACFSSGDPVLCPEVTRPDPRWPLLAAVASQAGFACAFCLPMRSRHEVIGVLNLFGTMGGALPSEDLHVAQALADFVTISLLQHRALNRGRELASQLQRALDTRVAIEQAKGIVAERYRLDISEAFGVLRRYARSHRMPLAEVANGIVMGTLTLDRPVFPKPNEHGSALPE